jgi:hypothetical protein
MMDGRAAQSHALKRAINVNIHHIYDLVGPDVRTAVPHIAGGSSADWRQAVLAALRSIEDVSRDRDHFVASGHRLAALLQSFLADVALAAGSISVDRNGLHQPAFHTPDASRLSGFNAWLHRNVQSPDRHAARDADRFAVTDIPDSASLALFGDWAAGTAMAEQVSRSIADSGCNASVHLGDVYYSGTARETVQFLLEPWHSSPHTIRRACNSNHEMFSGGAQYWERTLPALGQPSARFALRNRHWMIVGLDTATLDGHLGPAQVRELERLVRGSAYRRLVLLSHHPLFDTVTGPNDSLFAELGPLLATGRVAAWYWAHEHACLRFATDARIGHARLRCVGHGGFPYLAALDSQADRSTSGARQWFTKRLDCPAGVPTVEQLCGPSPFTVAGATYGPHGWLRLDLDGPDAIESLVGAEDQLPFANVY